MTLYQKTIGNPELRSHTIGVVYNLLKYGRYKSEGGKKYLESQLHAMGEGDYREFDTGEPPQGQTFE